MVRKLSEYVVGDQWMTPMDFGVINVKSQGHTFKPKTVSDQ